MSRVSSKEAAQLVRLLEATPESQRSEGWPPLLTLLTRWAAQDPQATPARPWERNTSATAPQQAALHTAHQQLLPAAAILVQACLHQTASEARVHPSGSAAAALGRLFVPSVLFLSAVLTADKPGSQGLQQLAVAATCEAAAALVAAPAALLPATGQTGLPAVLSSCRALLLACKSNASHAAWIVACLLSALHTAVPGIIDATIQQQQNQLQQPHPVRTVAAAGAQYSNRNGLVSAALAGGSSTSRQGDAHGTSSSWLQEQLQQSAACTVLPLLSGLYSLGHDFSLRCCQSAAATGHLRPPVPAATTWRAAEPAGVDSLDSNGSSNGGGSSSSSTRLQTSSLLQALQEVGSVLTAACSSQTDELLLGLAAAVTAGLCAGVLEGLPPAAAAAAAAAPAGPQRFAAAADAAWGSNMQHSGPQQQQQLRASQLAADSFGWRLLEQAEVLQQALRVACASCMAHSSQTAATARRGASTAGTVAAAAAAVGCGLLGQAFGRLMSGSGHVPEQLLSSQRSMAAQLQQQLAADVPGLSCTLRHLTEHCCSLSGVFHQAAGRHDAVAANIWLSAQQQQHPAQEVGTLTRWLAAAVKGCSGQELLHLLLQLRESGVQLARSYGSHYLSTPPAVASALDAAAVRQQLDLNFAVHVALLSEIWQTCNAHKMQERPHNTSAVMPASSAAGSGSMQSPATIDSNADSSCHGGLSAADLQAAAVAHGLSDLAALQFCRVQLPVYMELLRALVTSLASSSSAADAFMSVTLPCYERLIQPHPAALGSAGSISSGVCGTGASGAAAVQAEAVWLQDTVTAAELTFLLPLLPVAVRAASDAARAVQRVLPLLLLLLPHPVAAVAQAAHAAFAGVVAVAAAAAEQDPLKPSSRLQQQSAQHADNDNTEPNDEVHVPMLLPHQQQQQQRPSLINIVQQAVPMYLQRSLAALPGHGSLDGLSSSYYSLLKNLPTGSALGLFCVNQVAAKALELAVEAGAPAAAAGQDGVQLALHAGQQQQRQEQQPVPVSAAAAAGGQLELGGVAPNSESEQLQAAANKLFDLLVLSVQLGDYQLLQSTLEQVASCVKAAPLPVQRHWLSQLYAGCLAVGDYTRKPALMVWVDQLQKQLQLQQQQQARLLATASDTRAEKGGQQWQDTAGQVWL